MVYKRVQKNSSSSGPAPKKGTNKKNDWKNNWESPFTQSSFGIQPQADTDSTPHQGTNEYRSTNFLSRSLANIQRQALTESQPSPLQPSEKGEEVSNEAVEIQHQSESSESGEEDSNSANGGTIQRSCSECQSESQAESSESEISPQSATIQRQNIPEAQNLDQTNAIQPKLTIGAPGDKYEQEADSMAEKVMSMDAPTVQQQAIGHQGEEPEETIQRQPIATSITPLVQRFTEVIQRLTQEKLQAKAEIQTKGEGGTSRTTPSLESRLASQTGGGSPLDEQTRSFMEPRFGTNFNKVRVHTDTTAVQMNKELGAKAFAHGSDIYFGEGQSPGNNKLTAHELTHVVQQTGVKTLQQKPASLTSSNKESVLAKHSHEFLINPTSNLAKQTKANQQWQLDNKEDYLQKANITKFYISEDRSPNIQTKCAACAEEDKVQRQLIVDNKISYSESKSTVQAFGWDDVKNTVSSGAQWVGDKVGDVAALGADAFADIVAKVAPGLANLIRQGPVGLLTEKIQEGVKGWLSGVMSGVDIGSIVAGLQGSFTGVFAAVKALGNGDAASCGAFAQSIKSLQEMGQAFMDNPVFQQIQGAFNTVNGIFKKVTDLVVAPAFDALMGVAGSIFDGVKNLATTIWEWGAPVRNTLGAAWDWVKGKLGIGGDGEGGVFGWLKTKASEAWNQIKGTLAPVIGPLKAVGGALLAFTPAGQIYLIIKYVPQLVQAVQWLWANKDNPDIVKKAHAEMGNTILPGLLSSVQGFSETLQSAVTDLINQASQLGEAVLGLLGAVSGVPLLSIAQNLVQTVSNGVKDLIKFCQEGFQSAAQSVQNFFTAMAEKVKPYMGVLTSLGMAIANPVMIPTILAGWAWQALDDCYKAPIINFLLDIVIGALQAAPTLSMFGPLWAIVKTAVVGFLQGVRNQDDQKKIAVTNRLAQIISGGSPGFLMGFVKGLLKGIWEGVTDPFQLIYGAISGLSSLITWFENAVNDAFAPQAAVQGAAAAQGAPQAQNAEPLPQENKVDMGQRMQQMAGELQPPVNNVTTGFMPAVQEFFSGGEKLTFAGLMQKLGAAWAGVQNAIQGAAQQIAQKVFDFMLQPGADSEIGEGAGWLTGTIAFEVLLNFLTAGSWTPVSAAGKALQRFAKFLNLPGDLIGEAFGLLKKLGGLILDGMKGLVKLFERAGGAIKGVLGSLGEIAEKLIGFADELLSRFSKKATKEAVEAGTEKATKEAVEAGTEKSTKEAIEAGTEKSTKEATEAGTEKSTKEATDDAARKTAELPQAIEKAKVITEVNDAANTPTPILIGILTTTVKPQYSWIKGFEARPKQPDHYSIHMIASEHEIERDYTTQGVEKGATQAGNETAEKAAKQTKEQAAEVTIKGTGDAAHEAPQATRFGQLEGGGEFEFLRYSEGIEGYFKPRGSSDLIPVSLKNMPDVKSVKGAFREMRQNVPHVVNAGVKDAVLFTSLPRFTTEDVLTFLANNKPNVLPQPGVFKKIMIDCADGVIVLDAAGIATKL